MTNPVLMLVDAGPEEDPVTVIECPLCGRHETEIVDVEAAPEIMSIVAVFECKAGHRWHLRYRNEVGRAVGYFTLPETPTHRQETQSPIEELLFEALSVEMQEKTRMQRAIGPYFADFAFEAVRLVVECDGHEYHKEQDQRTHDAQRDRYMKRHGWETIRFTGSEINADPGACAREIEDLYREMENEG